MHFSYVNNQMLTLSFYSKSSSVSSFFLTFSGQTSLFLSF
ncbi:hypothetical protein KNP414_05362 [Paenibacillus mucilaginosus KNP414]|uniref:Uncharacterized protein n=1 Tax=Paenibacillus mucilaginosus (strain KNP414) TaxID=1036673 RepID=F8FG66_PAEMK|nr:hypothetical protein KNP414_05362 [Paenibacillus mucilaginosus KNP414]